MFKKVVFTLFLCTYHKCDSDAYNYVNDGDQFKFLEHDLCASQTEKYGFENHPQYFKSRCHRILTRSKYDKL